MKNKMILRPIRANGMVSITVTIIMMLVISVIVLGFAEVSRREQRVSLDRQLSTQAFLAAETGVNDARKVMESSLRATGTVQDKNTCDSPSGPYASLEPVIDSALAVEYTCLLVDTTLDSIRQSVAADGSGVTLPLRPVSGSIGTLRLKWTGADTATNTNCPTGVGPLTSANAWSCDYGILRVDIVPTTTLSRAAFMQQQRAFFFYPTRSSPVPNQSYGATAQAVRGTISPMSCSNATRDCQVNITGMGGSATYAIRVSGIYKPGTVEITSPGIVFKDAQAQIDATGKAGDVLRRIQVRLTLGQTNTTSGQALQSGSAICKRFGVTDSALEVSNTIAGQDPNNPMCRP